MIMFKDAFNALLVAFSVCLSIGCASTEMMSTNPAGIQSVREWTLGFTYEPGSIKRNVSDGEIESVELKQTGRNPKSLELLEDVHFLLQQNGINIVESSTALTGNILLNPIFFEYSSGFQSCSATFVTPEGKAIARLKIKNGDRNGTFKSDDSFAKYVANSITKELMP